MLSHLKYYNKNGNEDDASSKLTKLVQHGAKERNDACAVAYAVLKTPSPRMLTLYYILWPAINDLDAVEASVRLRALDKDARMLDMVASKSVDSSTQTDRLEMDEAPTHQIVVVLSMGWKEASFSDDASSNAAGDERVSLAHTYVDALLREVEIASGDDVADTSNQSLPVDARLVGVRVADSEGKEAGDEALSATIVDFVRRYPALLSVEEAAVLRVTDSKEEADAVLKEALEEEAANAEADAGAGADERIVGVTLVDESDESDNDSGEGGDDEGRGEHVDESNETRSSAASGSDEDIGEMARALTEPVVDAYESLVATSQEEIDLLREQLELSTVQYEQLRERQVQLEEQVELQRALLVRQRQLHASREQQLRAELLSISEERDSHMEAHRSSDEALRAYKEYSARLEDMLRSLGTSPSACLTPTPTPRPSAYPSRKSLSAKEVADTLGAPFPDNWSDTEESATERKEESATVDDAEVAEDDSVVLGATSSTTNTRARAAGDDDEEEQVHTPSIVRRSANISREERAVTVIQRGARAYMARKELRVREVHALRHVRARPACGGSTLRAELLQSERAYVYALSFLYERVALPIQRLCNADTSKDAGANAKSDAPPSSPSLGDVNTDQVAIVFADVEALCKLHRDEVFPALCDALAVDHDDEEGESALHERLATMLRTHLARVADGCERFAATFHNRLRALLHVRRNRQAQVILQRANDEMRLSVADLLVLPVLRVPQYYASLRSWSRVDGRMMGAVLQAPRLAASAKELARQVRDCESALRIYEMHANLFGDMEDLISPSRTFLRAGSLHVVQTEERASRSGSEAETRCSAVLWRHFYLLSDRLVYAYDIAVGRRYEGAILLDIVSGVHLADARVLRRWGVRCDKEDGAADPLDCAFQISLFASDGDAHVVLMANSPEERDSWISVLRATVNARAAAAAGDRDATLEEPSVQRPLSMRVSAQVVEPLRKRVDTGEAKRKATPEVPKKDSSLSNIAEPRKSAPQRSSKSADVAPKSEVKSVAAAPKSVGMIAPRKRPTVTEGFLTKQGAKRKNWKRRYFVVEGPFINYYARKLAPHDRKDPLGSIDLRVYTDVRLVSKKACGKDFCFELACPTASKARCYRIFADTNKDMAGWLATIEELIVRVTDEHVKEETNAQAAAHAATSTSKSGDNSAPLRAPIVGPSMPPPTDTDTPARVETPPRLDPSSSLQKLLDERARTEDIIGNDSLRSEPRTLGSADMDIDDGDGDGAAATKKKVVYEQLPSEEQMLGVAGAAGYDSYELMKKKSRKPIVYEQLPSEEQLLAMVAAEAERRQTSEGQEEAAASTEK